MTHANHFYTYQTFFTDTSASKKVSGGNNGSVNRVDSEVADPEIWTGVLMGLLITVLLIAFLIGFLVRLQANRARLQRYNQETRLATVTGENAPSNDMSSSNDKTQHNDNLNKSLIENPDYIKASSKSAGRALTSSGPQQIPLVGASPTDPDVVQLQFPAAGKSKRGSEICKFAKL